ncbi:hypothetical protein PENTCL1PPCAC_12948, partial [Pristionchus entomophagus]
EKDVLPYVPKALWYLKCLPKEEELQDSPLFSDEDAIAPLDNNLEEANYLKEEVKEENEDDTDMPFSHEHLLEQPKEELVEEIAHFTQSFPKEPKEEKKDTSISHHEQEPVVKRSRSERRNENIRKYSVNSTMGDFAEEGEEEDRIGHAVDAQKETVEKKKRRRPSRTVSRPLKYNESEEDFDENCESSESSECSEVEKNRRSSRTISINTKYNGSQEDSDEEPGTSVKKSRSKSTNRKNKATPKCILCETYPSTASGYSAHLSDKHKSTLKRLEVYLICACGQEFRSSAHDPEHIKKCDGLKFTLHKLDKKITPQCVLCEAYPTTSSGYVQHLYVHHRSTLKANGIFLLCSCGKEVRGQRYDANHSKTCEGLMYTLHKLSDKVYTTPKCILCEMHPTTTRGYATHLKQFHKSTLRANGFYLLCLCGEEIGCHSSNLNHDEKCDGRQFTLHKLSEKVYTTPKCILCETFPTSAAGYVQHLSSKHKSTLSSNGIFLSCSCGIQVLNCHDTLNHSKDCDRKKFTLHKLNRMTPKCVLCEFYPTTVNGYATHLYNSHKSSLKANGIYLKCSCGMNVLYPQYNPDHKKKCDGRQFSIHKLK